MNHFKQIAYKKFGLLDFTASNAEEVHQPGFEPFIKILFLQAGSKITVDFTDYQLEQDALFFINVNQWCRLDTTQSCSGQLLYYNRDFYCIQIHDHEVSCDGILYNNVYEIPVIHLSDEQSKQVKGIIEKITAELGDEDSAMEEMLRVLLKELIIRATRMWKRKHELHSVQVKSEAEFLRKFSQLVEMHFRQHHTVAAYADMLMITPKALHKRITQYGTTGPNELIKERIMLEAKRLLAHTEMSVKEIGYNLGYEDPAYFVRFFTTQAEISPLAFRKQFRN
jgi:AraC-like DNA-binding protein